MHKAQSQCETRRRPPPKTAPTLVTYVLKTDTTGVAQVIDFLIKEGRVKDEQPKVEPGLVATIPEPTSPEPASSTSPEVDELASSTSPKVNELASSEETSASSTSQEHAELAEEPTPILLEQHIQPMFVPT